MSPTAPALPSEPTFRSRRISTIGLESPTAGQRPVPVVRGQQLWCSSKAIQPTRRQPPLSTDHRTVRPRRAGSTLRTTFPVPPAASVPICGREQCPCDARSETRPRRSRWRRQGRAPESGEGGSSATTYLCAKSLKRSDRWTGRLRPKRSRLSAGLASHSASGPASHCASVVIEGIDASHDLIPYHLFRQRGDGR